ncbi:hypothetical protein BC940DRAFT_291294 [Gongronella butleri]|nr:hypothetical protein BC940DRAFT_291294 [Gongronella butleri]
MTNSSRSNVLIFQATTRLRRRLLEDQLSDVAAQFAHFDHDIGEMQAQLALTMRHVQQLTSYDVHTQNQQMDLLEWQLHQFQIMLCTLKKALARHQALNGGNAALPLTSHLTRPSGYSSAPKKSHDERQQPHLMTSAKKSKRMSIMSRESSVSHMSSVFSPPRSARHSISSAATDATSVMDDDDDAFSLKREFAPPTSPLPLEKTDDAYQLDTLDQTLAYIDQLQHLASDDVDQELLDDLAFLLDHPDACDHASMSLTGPKMTRARPSSYPAPTMHHHAYAPLQKKNITRSSPATAYDQAHVRAPSHSGWQWCRFLSVVSASYVLSILKGPDDLTAT